MEYEKHVWDLEGSEEAALLKLHLKNNQLREVLYHRNKPSTLKTEPETRHLRLETRNSKSET